MIRGICDTRERIPARIYGAIRRALDPEARLPDAPPDCPCCAFWRGVVIGAVVASAAAAILYWKG